MCNGILEGAYKSKTLFCYFAVGQWQQGKECERCDFFRAYISKQNRNHTGQVNEVD